VIPRALPAAALLAAAACAVPPALPTISEYTDGASAVAADVDALFRTGRVSPSLSGAAGAPFRGAAAAWREAAADGAEVESSIVDFPRRPERSATMRVRVVLSGTGRGDPSTRVFADERFALDLVRGEGGWALAAARAEQGGGIRAARPHLEETSRAWGVSATHESCDPAEKTNYCIPATHHHPGIVLADFDGDGALDILLPSLHPRLLLNDGHGRFRDATEGSGLDRLPPGEAAGGVAADLDGDGLPEIFLTYAYSACRLLHNEGGGKFRDVTEESGLAGLFGTYTSAVFFDADRDGRLDLFVAAYGDARTTGPAYSGKTVPGAASSARSAAPEGRSSSTRPKAPDSRTEAGRSPRRPATSTATATTTSTSRTISGRTASTRTCRRPVPPASARSRRRPESSTTATGWA